jgi:hypothetical protein
MNTLTKCQFIEDFSRICIEEKIYSDFVTINDLGIPLAISVVAEIADLKGRGQEIINETYSLMCELLEVSADKEYEYFEDMLEDSNYKEGDGEGDN